MNNNFLKRASVIGVCATLTACSSTPASESLFTAGTYSASAEGFKSTVIVTTEFSDSEIVSIEVESEETDTVGEVAIDDLVEEVLSTQTVNVDTVSGATYSSTAFITSIKDCVTQAGADPESLSGNGSSTEITYETEADIIVVGGGAAGMSAAIAATDAGASVILLEKSSVLGGNTVCSANGINAADSDVQLADETYQEVGASKEGLTALQLNNEDAQEDLVTAFVENSADTINWLSDLGVEFTVDIAEDDRNEDTNYYMLKADEYGTTALTIINYVSKTMDEKGITYYTNMDAYELVTDDNGTVTGVIATNADGEDITFSGRAVLLATGGFGQNSELVAEVNPELANATTDEIAPTTGEGLLMAQELGAGTVNLDAIQTFPHVIPGFGMITPNNLPGGFTPDAIYVNNSAVRFTAEGFEIVDEILAQDEGEVYCIFDDSGMNDTLQGYVDNGTISSGETVEELAEALGLDAETLATTVENFNEDIADGVDDEFGKTENLDTLEGTLYGYRFGVGAHYFMGGLTVNDSTQVLDTDGNVIEGLYAAGEVTGGFHGTFRVDGSGLGDSFTFGRLAGKTMAAAVAE